jgi:transposase
MFSWRCFPFVESAPRAYRLKASNAAPSSSTSAGTFPNQVFGWRKRYRDEAGAPAVRSASQLIPVMVTAGPDAVVMQASTAAAAIEIDLAGKYRVRVGSRIEAEALRRVLDVLERR